MWPHSPSRILTFTALLAFTACATGLSRTDDDVAGNPDAGAFPPDSSITPLPDGAVSPPDAPPATTPDAATGTADAASSSTPVTLSHSNSMTVAEQNTIACAQDTTGYHTENSYYRVFDLASFGVTGALHVTSVDVGIESAVAASGGSQPATLVLYTLSGAASTANLTQISSTSVDVTDRDLDVMTINVSATIPAGATLVVEFAIPDGTTAGDTLYVGSNTSGETGPTYIRAPGCAVDDMTTLSSLSYPDVAWVLDVNGTY